MRTVFIGFEPAEEVAYHVLASSILRHASEPIAIVPLDRRKLAHCHNRPYDAKQSNSFTYVRFLVPYLSNYEGASLFMDSDMIVRDDIHKLFDMMDEGKDLMCVQHPDYTSTMNVKYLGNVQYNYPRKNWSSVMLFNNSRCRVLNPLYIDHATPRALHRMEWATSIGDLPKEWNHLVGEQAENANAKIVHYTLGTPCWKQFENCEFADEWRLYLNRVNYFLEESKATG